MNTKYFTRAVLSFVAALSLTAIPAFAQTFTATGTNGTGAKVSAEADFAVVNGTDLQVTLKNTTAGGSLNRGDLLTGLFFSIGGSPFLSLNSALASTVQETSAKGGQITTTNNVNLNASVNNGAWQFLQNPNVAGEGYGIGTAGYSSLNGGVFNGNLVDGSTYGIFAPGTDITAADFKSIPLVNTMGVFVFSGLASLVGLPITNVEFSFGTAPEGLLAGESVSPTFDGGGGSSVPELDPGLLISSLTLLVGCTFIITSKNRKNAKRVQMVAA